MLYADDILGTRAKAYRNGEAQCCICERLVRARCGEINVWHWAHESVCSDTWAYEPTTEWHLKWQDHFRVEQQEVVLRKLGTIHRADVQTEKCVIEFQHSAISSRDIAAREFFYDKMIWVIDAHEFALNLSFPRYAMYAGHVPPGIHVTRSVSGALHSTLQIPPDDKGEIQRLAERAGYKQHENGLWHKSAFPGSLDDDKVRRVMRAYHLRRHLDAESDRSALQNLRFEWKYIRRSWKTARKPLFLDLNNGYLLRVKQFTERGCHISSIGSKETFLQHYGGALGR